MFDNMLVVSTAISSFNNAALYSPFFIVVGLLSLPLFFMVYVYGKDFVSKIGWNENNLDGRVSFWIAMNLLAWLMLFGGNYAVIRDGISLLPAMISCILFSLMIIIVNQGIKLGYLKKLQNKKAKWLLLFVLLLMTVFSSVWTWWGVLLQIVAIFCGMIVGVRIKKNISLVPWVVFVLFLLIISVLMQPEYFRFGQLGNLTIVHILAMGFAGFCAITAIVAQYTNPRGRIHQSAYVKLKWLFRIMALLAFVLFVMTESVPVFVGFVGALGLLEMLSIYHSKNISEDLSKLALAMLMMVVGVIIICPVITGLGIVYMISKTNSIKSKDFMRLL